jgi:hypothetical protein
MKLTIWWNEFVFIAKGVFSSFRRHKFFKDLNSRESSSMYYLWIINVQKDREPNSPEAPT